MSVQGGAGIGVEIHGMAEFRKVLRNLPRELADAAIPIVNNASESAATAIRAGYLQLNYENAGLMLADSVVVEPFDTTGQLAAGARVRVRNKLADIFEIGAASRKTSAGLARGSITPGHVFVPRVVLARRAMYQTLVGLVEQAGFIVKGAIDDAA